MGIGGIDIASLSRRGLQLQPVACLGVGGIDRVVALSAPSLRPRAKRGAQHKHKTKYLIGHLDCL